MEHKERLGRRERRAGRTKMIGGMLAAIGWKSEEAQW